MARCALAVVLAVVLAVCAGARGAEAPRAAPVSLQLLQALVDGSRADLRHMAVAVVALPRHLSASCPLPLPQIEDDRWIRFWDFIHRTADDESTGASFVAK
jgi:hypothetical protein